MTNKYKNRQIEINGKKFQSEKEARRYNELLLLQRAGEIKNLECQVVFPLIEKNDKNRAVTYKADFVYDKDGNTVVEDIKPDNLKWYKTTSAWAVYNIKKKLMYDKYRIEVVEI